MRAHSDFGGRPLRFQMGAVALVGGQGGVSNFLDRPVDFQMAARPWVCVPMGAVSNFSGPAAPFSNGRCSSGGGAQRRRSIFRWAPGLCYGCPGGRFQLFGPAARFSNGRWGRGMGAQGPVSNVGDQRLYFQMGAVTLVGVPRGPASR